MRHTIKIDIANAAAFLEPVDRLNGDFQTYLSTTKRGGFRFTEVGARKGQAGPFAKLPKLVEALSATFDLVLTDAAREAIEALNVDAAPAGSDVEAVLDAMAARGQRPYPYQIDGIAYFAERDAALNHDDMGLGKTMQSLAALPLGARAVIVCPASVKGAWAKEVAKWRPDLTARIVNGRGDASRLVPAAGEVVICNYDILPAADGLKAGTAFAKAFPTGVVAILDEAHMVKTFKAARTKNARALVGLCRRLGGKGWLLTGTPLLNNPGESWTIMQAVGLGSETFGDYDKFKRLFGGRDGAFGVEWDPALIAPEASGMLARATLGRRKEAVLTDLPAKRHETVPVSVDSKIFAQLDRVVAQLEAAGFKVVDGVIFSKANPGEPASLEEITGNKLAFEQISRARSLVATAKIPAAVELVEQYEEAGEPVVVFTAHVEPAQALAKRPGWALVDGSVDSATRSQAIEDFQAGKLKGIVGTRAMAEGVTLTRASNMLFIDRFWSPGINDQAEDRIHRIGQKSACLYRILEAAHPVDQLVSNLLAAKREAIESTFDAAAATVVVRAPKTSPYANVLALPAFVAPVVEARPAAERAPAAPTGDGPYRKLVEMLEASGNKYPRLWFLTPAGERREAGLCGPRSRTPGAVNVTDGAAFDSSIFFGRVLKNGRLCPQRPVTSADVLAGLDRLVADPAAAAKIYAEATGRCCFCGIELDIGESVERGYGPTCAEKYNMAFDRAKYEREIKSAKAVGLARG